MAAVPRRRRRLRGRRGACPFPRWIRVSRARFPRCFSLFSLGGALFSSLHFFVRFFLRSSGTPRSSEETGKIAVGEENAGGRWTRGNQRVVTVTVTVRPAPRWKRLLLADLVFRCPNVGASWTTIIICAIVHLFLSKFRAISFSTHNIVLPPDFLFYLLSICFI
jgi:hypothetical protein